MHIYFSATVTSIHEAHSSASRPLTMHGELDQNDSTSEEIDKIMCTETEPIIVNMKDCTTQTHSATTNQSQCTQTDSNMVSYSQ